MPTEELEFEFEKRAAARGATRRLDQQHQGASLVLRRWGLTDQQVAALLALAPVRVRIDRYVSEYPLNIAWYEAHHEAERRNWRLLIAGAVALAVVPLVASAVVMIPGVEVTTPTLVPLLGALLASGYGVLKVVATAVDVKARFAGFWKAAADLKERLYSFEETWSGKSIVQGSAFTEEFAQQLEAELVAGRTISREEREAFFATFKAPLEVLEVAKSSYEGALAKLAGALAVAPAPKALPASTPTNGAAAASHPA